MNSSPLPRIDTSEDLCRKLLGHCRLQRGDIWVDPILGHKVGCLDASDPEHVMQLMGADLAHLAIHDPPYNLVAFQEREINSYINWCRSWIKLTDKYLAKDSSLYVWLGADQKRGFQPLAEFMIMMRGMVSFRSRSLITLRNQRGYRTQGNWMAVRQELLYYVKGNPDFKVQYTEIPKVLRGYYKKVGGKITENVERSRSCNIRPGNVWIDVQQVFYRMGEHVSGCYAQKPIKAIDRIVAASSDEGDLVIDFFAHSGTTLLSCEMRQRCCYTMDIDPVFCEITLRRLEHLRHTGQCGWQNGSPFEDVSHLRDSGPITGKTAMQASLF